MAWIWKSDGSAYMSKHPVPLPKYDCIRPQKALSAWYLEPDTFVFGIGTWTLRVSYGHLMTIAPRCMPTNYDCTSLGLRPEAHKSRSQ